MPCQTSDEDVYAQTVNLSELDPPLYDQHLTSPSYTYTPYPVETINLPPALAHHFTETQGQVAMQGFVRLHDVLMLPSGYIITNDGRLLRDCLPNDRATQEVPTLMARAQSLRLRADVPREKRSVLLLHQNGQGNYGHWLADALPRLRGSPGSPCQDLPVLIHSKNLNLALKTAPILPGTPAFEAWPATGMWLREAWFARRCNQGPRHHCIEGLRWLRQIAWQNYLGTQTPPAPSRRLYISRDDSHIRKLLNEREVWPMLAQHGFERISCGHLPFAEQVRLLSQAEYVVGIVGAALANLVFCQPGAQALLLVPDNRPFMYYHDIVQLLERPLAATWLFGPAQPPQPGRLDNECDFSIDPALLQHWLTRLPPHSKCNRVA